MYDLTGSLHGDINPDACKFRGDKDEPNALLVDHDFAVTLRWSKRQQSTAS